MIAATFPNSASSGTRNSIAASPPAKTASAMPRKDSNGRAWSRASCLSRAAYMVSS